MRRLDAIPSSHRPRTTYGSAVMERQRARRKHTTRGTAAGAIQVCSTPDDSFDRAALCWVWDLSRQPRSGCWTVSETAVAQLAWLGGQRGDMETRGRDSCEDSSRTTHLHNCCRTRRLRTAPDLSCGLNFAFLHTSPPVAEPSLSFLLVAPILSPAVCLLSRSCSDQSSMQAITYQGSIFDNAIVARFSGWHLHTVGSPKLPYAPSNLLWELPG